MQRNVLCSITSLAGIVIAAALLLRLRRRKTVGFRSPIRTCLPRFPSTTIAVHRLLARASSLGNCVGGHSTLATSRLVTTLVTLAPKRGLNGGIICASAKLLLTNFVVRGLAKGSIRGGFRRHVGHPLTVARDAFRPASPVHYIPARGRPAENMVHNIIRSPGTLSLKKRYKDTNLFTPVGSLVHFSQVVLRFKR